MKCKYTLYKFDGTNKNNIEVFYRSEASWESWCPDGITVNDLGAWCDFQRKITLDPEQVLVKIDDEDIKIAEDILTKRYRWCVENSSHVICKPKKDPSIFDGFFYSEDDLYMEEKSEPKRGGWRYDTCRPTSFRPVGEVKNFFDLSITSYIDMHLPEKGLEKCYKDGDPIVVYDVNMRKTLDFLTFEFSQDTLDTDPSINEAISRSFEECDKFGDQSLSVYA